MNTLKDFPTIIDKTKLTGYVNHWCTVWPFIQRVVLYATRLDGTNIAVDEEEPVYYYTLVFVVNNVSKAASAVYFPLDTLIPISKRLKLCGKHVDWGVFTVDTEEFSHLEDDPISEFIALDTHWTLFPADSNVVERRVSRDVYREIGRKGGSKSKKNTVLTEAIRKVLMTKPDLTHKPASSMWRHIKRTYNSLSPLKTAKGKLFFDDDHLVSECKGKIKSISQNTFDKYVADIKKESHNKPAK